MKTQCHCKAVTITIPCLPEKLNACSCSICRRYGALWAYYEDTDLTLQGPTDTYIWGDKMLAFHRCKTCGVLTHWARLDGSAGRMGVNLKNADQTVLKGIAVIDSNNVDHN